MIAWSTPHYWGNEKKYVLEALDSTWISGGPFVERLEHEYAKKSGAQFSIAVSNGTSALHLAFLGIDLKAGDEVIVPGFCFLAAANVAIHMGAIPVFAEVDPRTWCLDPEDVEKKITKHTKVIVPVHSYGNSCDMDEIIKIASDNRIFVIEDAAEAIGTKFRGRWVGTIGDIGCFSFHATKTMATGEGGMVVTNDPGISSKMRLYRSHGMGIKKYWHEVPGHNFRITNIQAAIGVAQLENSERIFSDRIKIYSRYKSILHGQKGVVLQEFKKYVSAVPWSFTCMLDEDIFGDRDGIMERLSVSGIESRPGFYPASMQPIYCTGKLPICEQISKRIISLPGSPPSNNLDIEWICSVLLAQKGM